MRKESAASDAVFAARWQLSGCTRAAVGTAGNAVACCGIMASTTAAVQ